MQQVIQNVEIKITIQQVTQIGINVFNTQQNPIIKTIEIRMQQIM